MVEWTEEFEDGRRGDWVKACAWYYIRMSNELLVQEGVTSFVRLVIDHHVRLLACVRGGEEDFAYLLEEVERVQASSEVPGNDDVLHDKEILQTLVDLRELAESSITFNAFNKPSKRRMIVFYVLFVWNDQGIWCS